MSATKRASRKNHFSSIQRLTPVAAVILALGAGSAYGAADYTWATAITGNWDDASKWSPSTAYPVAGKSADILLNSTSAITVTVRSTAAASVLTLGNPAALGSGKRPILSVSSGVTLSVDMFNEGAPVVGAGTVQTGALNWYQGNMYGNGSTIVTGSATISGNTWGSNVGLAQVGNSPVGGPFTTRTLELRGTTNFTGANLQLQNGSTVTNTVTGTFNSKNSAGPSTISSYDASANTFNNHGTFYQDSGTQTTSISAIFNNTGTVNVHTGTLRFGNGTLYDYTQTASSAIMQVDSTLMAANVNIADGILTGSGTVSANVTNNGMLLPGNSPGKLAVTGSFSQGAAGMLDVEIGGPVQGNSYDWLAVSGAAHLGGSLNVFFVNGFTPTVGQTFQVLSSTGLDGSFSNVFVEGPSGVVLNTLYSSTGVTLQVAAVPEPESYAMILAGLGLMALVVRRRKR